MSTQPDARWNLTRQGFARLLDRLGNEPEGAAREYESLHRRLVAFFEVRGVETPEALADATIDRVAARLEEGEVVTHLRSYFFGVAHRLALEWPRQRTRERCAATEAERVRWSPDDDEEIRDQRAGCLKRCLGLLPRERRELIVAYYRDGAGLDQERRQRLAARLGITYTNLKARAHRVRREVEGCMQECLRERGRPR